MTNLLPRPHTLRLCGRDVVLGPLARASVHLLQEPRPTTSLDLLGDVELVLRDHVEHLGVDEVKLLLDHGPEVVEQLLALTVLEKLLVPSEHPAMEVVLDSEVEHAKLWCPGRLLVDREAVQPGRTARG